MKEQQNIQTQQAKDKKGLLKKIGAWFASPDGMQTLRFISAIAAVIAVGVICALLGIYMDKDNFLPKERNYALIGACAIELALIFIIAKFFSIQKKLKKSETKGYIDPFTAAFMLGLNSYFLPDFVMGSYFPKSNVLYILLGILLCWLLYLIGAVIFPKPHAWFCGVNVIFAIYALAQYYVTEFRGNPVQFADLANIKSASEINGMYSLFLDSNVMFVLCDLILIIAVTVTTKVRKIKIRSRIISGVAVIAGCFLFVYGGRFAYDLGIKNRYIRLNFSGAENADTNGKTITLYSHMNGTAVKLEDVEDEVFSQKILGEGAAVEPSEGKLYAPCDGKIDSVFDTKHAVNMVSDDGVEILLHIGIDTVKLGGQYFEAHVSDGQEVKKGDLLISFDMDKIKAAGYKVTTPLIIGNTDDYASVEPVAQNSVSAGDIILKIK